MPPLELRILRAVAEVPREAWNALLDAGATPFLDHRFLDALEQSGCAAPEAGWTPRHLALFRAGSLVAVAPAYVKEDSDGDFSRDFGWAQAAGRAGLPYYPKLLLTVPFTPCTGRRVLVAAGEDRAAAVEAIVAGATALAEEEGIATIHALFPDEAGAEELQAAGLARRISFQNHWQNRGYRTPDDFLARLSSKGRNMARRERAAPGKQGISLRTIRGEELAAGARLWGRAAHALHRSTVDKLMWGRGWLDRSFYDRLFATMPEHLEVVAAERGGALVAGAFNVSSATRLYGRYWGCHEEHPFLHFNVCLYHSIDDCIARGLQAFEGGAGGDHKISRGFEPTETHSAHLFLDARLDQALRAHLRDERAARTAALANFRLASPVLKPDPDAP